MSSVSVQLMSGDVFSFDIFDGYKFRNLRGEFYELMGEELSIQEIECISLFDEGEIVDLDDFVVSGKTYTLFIDHVYVNFLCQDNKIRIEHIYENFPRRPIVNVCITEDDLDNAYRLMYETIETFQYEIDFQRELMEEDGFYNEDDLPQNFEEYVQENYGGDISFEDLLREYLKTFVSRHVKIREIVYKV